MHDVTVNLGERSYPIHIGSGLLDAETLAILLLPCVQGKQCMLISNQTVFDLFGAAVIDALGNMHVDVFTMSDGEQFKNLDSFADAMNALMSKRHNRTTCIVALGGGVVGDLAGFVAATFQRGVDFVQIPTTLLAQVDSSVGGKTAVNHSQGKNMIGAFYQPKAVIIDTDVLKHLPEREYAAGLAEVVKYGVIADAGLFSWLEENVDQLASKDQAALAHVIKRSVQIKADIVAADEREGGVRAILNYGHTFGHAVENISGYGVWLHGEAVAIGMVMAADFAVQIGMLAADQATRIRRLVMRLALPCQPNNPIDVDAMLQAMGMDKKVADGKLRFILADKIGQVKIVEVYDPQDLYQVLQAQTPVERITKP